MTIERKHISMNRFLTKHKTIVTELIYFWTLSENRLTIVAGKKSRFRAIKMGFNYYEMEK